jgi:hypothetical protein
LNVPRRYVGVTYQGAQTQIADGYSLTTHDGVSIYGVAPNGNVQVIALAQYSETSPNVESIGRLRTLARDFNLDLVHWCRCVRVPPDDPLFESLLSNNAKEPRGEVKGGNAEFDAFAIDARSGHRCRAWVMFPDLSTLAALRNVIPLRSLRSRAL